MEAILPDLGQWARQIVPVKAYVSWDSPTNIGTEAGEKAWPKVATVTTELSQGHFTFEVTL